MMSEGLDIQSAALMVGDVLDSLCAKTGISTMDMFISGDSNFRKKIYPEYKANRRTMIRPPMLEPLKQWALVHWEARVEDTLEADDLLGFAQTDETVIVSIDKDMLMIPGWHYNYVKDELKYVTNIDGLRHFYTQILVGDPADNIKGAKGIGAVKAERILRDAETEEEMLEAVADYFSCWEELDMTARLLWIQQKGRKDWNETGIGESQRKKFAEDCSGLDPDIFSDP